MGSNKLGRLARCNAGLLASISAAAIITGHAIGAPADSAAQLPESLTAAARFVQQADAALKTGNINLAIIQLKNAVQLSPTNGEIRAQLGIALMRGGDSVSAERELRQARNDFAPPDLVVPAILRVMLQRNEAGALLVEFPEPAAGAPDRQAPNIFAARAEALQRLGRGMEARAEMDRALKLKLDADELVASAALAQQQGDLVLARRQTDEALKIAPANEGALTSGVQLAREAGDFKAALADADEYLKRVPGSAAARALHIEVLLELKKDATAKEEVDALLKQQPKSPFGQYARAVLMARANDFKGAWRAAQTLPPEFVQSESQIAKVVASIAQSSGNAESGGGILTTLLQRHPADRLARLQLASLRLTQKSPQAAIDVLSPLKSTNDPSAHALLAQALLDQGHVNDAIASLEIASSSKGATPLLKRELALAELQAGENDRGVQQLRELRASDPANPQLAAPLIAALGRSAKWDEALAVADDLTQRHPKNPLGPFYRGQILAARGDMMAGIAAFGKALAIDPKFTPALYNRATVSMMRGDRQLAARDLQQIIANDPANLRAYINLAEIALDDGHDADALAVLNRAVKAVPSDPGARLALANYQVRERKYDDAAATVNELLRLSPNNPEALALKGNVELAEGQVNDAVKTYRTLANGSNAAEAYVLLARTLFVANKPKEADDAAAKAVELAPNSPQMRLELAQIEIADGKSQSAIATAQAFGAADPGPDADLLMSDVLLRLNRAGDAEAMLEKTAEAKTDSRVVTRLSQIAQNRREWKKADDILTAWINKHPDDFDLKKRRAGLLMDSGDLPNARGAYEALLKLRPDDAVVLNNLGWIMQKDDPARALSLVTRAMQIAPQSAEIADTVGWMKYQTSDRGAALPLLQRAHDLDNNNAPIAYHFAMALEAAGKRSEAKALLETVLLKNPHFAGADEARQALAHW